MSFAGKSFSNYQIVEAEDIVYSKSPFKANSFGIIKVKKGLLHQMFVL
jgi:type I restriction enzyme S subunit